jgi:hypothetical protein
MPYQSPLNIFLPAIVDQVAGKMTLLKHHKDGWSEYGTDNILEFDHGTLKNRNFATERIANDLVQKEFVIAKMASFWAESLFWFIDSGRHYLVKQASRGHQEMFVGIGGGVKTLMNGECLRITLDPLIHLSETARSLKTAIELLNMRYQGQVIPIGFFEQVDTGDPKSDFAASEICLRNFRALEITLKQISFRLPIEVYLGLVNRSTGLIKTLKTISL